MPSASRSGTMVIEIVVAQHCIDVAVQRVAQARDTFEAGSAIAVGATAIVSRQYAEIIFEAMREFGGSAHCGDAQVCMEVAQMQDGEAVEGPGQICEPHDVAAQLHLARVRQAQPIGPRDAKRYLNHHLHQGQVLEVQKAQPLAKGLRLVLALHAETELRVQRPEFELRDDAALRRDRVSGAPSRRPLPQMRSRWCRHAAAAADFGNPRNDARTFLMQVESVCQLDNIAFPSYSMARISHPCGRPPGQYRPWKLCRSEPARLGRRTKWIHSEDPFRLPLRF